MSSNNEQTQVVELSQRIERLRTKASLSKKDEEIASLQNQLADLKDKFNASIFWVTAVGIVIFDALLFNVYSHPLFITFVLGLEVIFLSEQAKKCGINKAVVLFDKAYHALCAWLDRKGNGEK